MADVDIRAPAQQQAQQALAEQRPSAATLRRIQKKQTRQVTLCKRRKGLFKKAQELSTMCDAEVGVIVFSPSGKLSEFATSSIPKVIRRYHGEHVALENSRDLLQEIQFCRNECIILRQQINSLSKIQSDMLGESDGTSLGLNDVIVIEANLYNALNNIYKRKVQVLCEVAEQAHKKVQSLKEENGFLRLKPSNIDPDADYNIQVCSSTLWRLYSVFAASPAVEKASSKRMILERCQYQFRCQWCLNQYWIHSIKIGKVICKLKCCGKVKLRSYAGKVNNDHNNHEQNQGIQKFSYGDISKA